MRLTLAVTKQCKCFTWPWYTMSAYTSNDIKPKESLNVPQTLSLIERGAWKRDYVLVTKLLHTSLGSSFSVDQVVLSLGPRPHPRMKEVWWHLSVFLVVLSQQSCFRTSQSDCRYPCICMYPSNIWLYYHVCLSHGLCNIIWKTRSRNGVHNQESIQMSPDPLRCMGVWVWMRLYGSGWSQCWYFDQYVHKYSYLLDLLSRQETWIKRTRAYYISILLGKLYQRVHRDN